MLTEDQLCDLTNWLLGIPRFGEHGIVRTDRIDVLFFKAMTRKRRMKIEFWAESEMNGQKPRRGGRRRETPREILAIMGRR